MCGPCTMLRPEPGFEKAILATLANADAAGSAAWYIQRWYATSANVLVALVEASGSSMLRSAIEQYAPRVPNTGELLVPLLPALAATPRARAFYALASVKLDDAQRAELLRAIEKALDGDDVATEAAADRWQA